MTELVIRTIAMTLAGAICGAVTSLWIRNLQQERGFEYSLSSAKEHLLSIVTAAAGACLGITARGLIVPLCGLILICICGAVSVIDWTYRVIPNQTVIAVLLLKLIMFAASAAGLSETSGTSLGTSLIGFAVCFAVFMIPCLFGKKIGAGDVKLAAAMGFLLGFENALFGVTVMGVLILVYSLVQRRMPVLMFLKKNIPMGPFIAAGMFLAFVGSNYYI